MFVKTLQENPELAIFLTLAIGFVIGRLRFGTFQLGNVVGTLLAGVLVGQLNIRVDPLVKVVFFDLFLFATGYKVGPQFFRGLKQNALQQALLTLVLCVASLAVTVTFAKIMRYDSGTAAGLMAGAFTESTVIGTAGNTISRLDLPEIEKERLLNNIPVAYAVSYLVGTGFVVYFLSRLAPRLLRVNLREESRKLEGEAAGSKSGSATRSAYREWDVRAYRLPAALAGKSIADVERSFEPARVFVQRIRRGAEVIEGTPDTVLQPGDTVAVGARRHVLLAEGAPFGAEVEDRSLLDFPLAALDVVVTKKKVAERSLADMASEHGRGIVLVKLVRGGEEIPFGPDPS